MPRSAVIPKALYILFFMFFMIDTFNIYHLSFNICHLESYVQTYGVGTAERITVDGVAVGVAVSVAALLRIPSVTNLAGLPEVVACEIDAELGQRLEVLQNALGQCVADGEILQAHVSTVLNTPGGYLIVVLVDPLGVGIGGIISVAVLRAPCVADVIN